MHLEYYGLWENPFSITSDTRFLYWSENHQSAFRHLLFSIQSKKGIVALSGEVGTGKTTVLNVLIKHLQESDEGVFIVHITNSKLSMEDIFRYIFHEVGIEIKSSRKGDYLFYLKDFLLQQLQKKRRLLLILDEAQNYSYDTLEDVRLLSNIEVPGEKLLQIILAGQPQLVQKINDKRIYQLKQRVNVIYNLSPLSFEETQNYIQKRLEIAGAKGKPLFHDKAVERIYAYSRGIPRVINLLGDNALLYGYAAQKSQIDQEIIRRAAADMALINVATREDIDPRDKREDRPDGRIPGRNVHPYESPTGHGDEVIVEYTKRFRDRVHHASPLSDVGIHNYDYAFDEENGELFRKKSSTFIKILIILIVLLAVWALTKTAIFQELTSRFFQKTSRDFTEQNQNLVLESSLTQDTHRPFRYGDSDVNREKKEKNSSDNIPSESLVTIKESLLPNSIERQYTDTYNSPGMNATKGFVIVKEGDVLTKIIENEYGEYNSYTLNLVLNANPHITNMDRIFIGQYIHLPKR